MVYICSYYNDSIIQLSQPLTMDEAMSDKAAQTAAMRSTRLSQAPLQSCPCRGYNPMDYGLWTMGSETVDYGLWAMKIWIVGFETMDYGLWNYGLPMSAMDYVWTMGYATMDYETMEYGTWLCGLRTMDYETTGDG